MVPLDTPYPGSNLLSLASGGAIYVRDPHKMLVRRAAQRRRVSAADRRPTGSSFSPTCEENERLFDIQVERDLLTVDGVLRDPRDVYRKVIPAKDAEAEAEMEGLGE